jgi:hypothetical protein
LVVALQEHGVAANEELAMQASMVFYAILTRPFRNIVSVLAYISFYA